MRKINLAKEAADLVIYAKEDIAAGGSYIRSFTVEDLTDFWVETFWAEVEHDAPTPAEEAEITAMTPKMEAELAVLGVPAA
jgi:hypothetical protein